MTIAVYWDVKQQTKPKMIRVIHKMDLGVGEKGFIFCDKTSSPCDKDSGELSRAHRPSCVDSSVENIRGSFGKFLARHHISTMC